ncbi:hypothetical protein [Streptomyces sp. NPDC001410]|uniref:hypothetical protein n=1 Tax=Streptomyces sp. NPDC001410 TaxID=3364574 RepID=UPI00367E4C01
MSIRHARRAVVTAVAVAALTVAGAGTASADGVVTWHHRPSDNCLAIVINKQTGRWLDSNGRSVCLGPGGWNNDNKYQLWY